ncbi:MAG TPA: NUDIX hydrolase [Thermomicrobiales bacterium]|jgi:ADP-ribose pyrophosphatase YjhB (NUDIX family)|nr:NUDIX hydrolase [Thermomicrobiales bacterium]
MALHCQRCGNLTVSRFVDGRTRPVCSGCGAVTYQDPRLAVTVVILRDVDGRRSVLLGRRAAHTRNPGGWSFPAGFVDRGEQVETAARREVREETGLETRLGPLLGVWSQDGEATVLLAWVCTEATGVPIAQDDLTSLAWHPVDDLPSLAFPHDPAILAAALEAVPGLP